MAKYTKATLEGEVPMTLEEEAYWDKFLAEQQAIIEAQRQKSGAQTIPVSTL